MDGIAETETQDASNERTLIIRSNRLLGTALIESGLVDSSAIEAAHEKLLMNIESGIIENPSILTSLIFEQKVLKEADLIKYTLEHHSVGLIDIRHYTLDSLPPKCTLGKCFATWTVPFDHRDGIYFLATSHYLSKPVIETWENILNAPIFWYVTAMRSIMIALKKLSTLPQHDAEDSSEQGTAPEQESTNNKEEAKPDPHAEDDDEDDVFEFSSKLTGDDTTPQREAESKD